jgi:hypothetical protein
MTGIRPGSIAKADDLQMDPFPANPPKSAAELRDRAIRYRAAAAIEADYSRAKGWLLLAEKCESRAHRLDELASKSHRDGWPQRPSPD